MKQVDFKVDQLKAGATLSYIAMGIGYLVSIIYTPIMLRLLGQSEYGLYNLVASVVAYLGVLNFGFGSAYMRYYSKYKINDDNEKIAKLNGMFFIVFAVIGLIAVVAGMILVINSDLVFGSKLSIFELATAKKLMIVLVINLAISFFNTVFRSNIIANEKFIFQKSLEIVSALINPFLVFPILLLGYGSVGMVVVTTILNLAIEIFNMIYCFKKLKMKFDFKNFDLHLMKDMTIFSSFIFLYLVVEQINWHVDKYIIGRFIGTSEVAVYSIGSQLNIYLINIAAAISFVFVPRINKIVAKDPNDKAISELFIKIGRFQYIFVMLALIGFIVFGETFIYLWAGADYARSYQVAVVLMIPTMTVLIQNIGVEIRKAKNQHQTPARFMVMIAILNIMITIPLTKAYGSVGSALGTSITIVINQIFINYYYHKVVNLDIKNFWLEILAMTKGIIIPVVIAIVLILIRSNFSNLNFLLMAFPFTLIYMISMYFLGLNETEKNMFINNKMKSWINSLRK